MEQNGTYDMGGNVWEWSEGTDGPNQVFVGGTYELSSSEMRSGDAWKNANVATTSATDIGFRVVAIPEPATALLFGLGGIGAWLLRRNKLKSKEDEKND